jgi:hypothetical protein
MQTDNQMRYSDRLENYEVHRSFDEIAWEILAMGLFQLNVEF